MDQIRFRAMGADVHVIGVGGASDAPSRARAAIERLEQRWSRFVPDSEISRLNASAGRPVVVSDETFDLVALACEGKRLSGGAYDPLLLPALIAAGYDRTFEQLDPSRSRAHLAPSAVHDDRIELDVGLSAVRLPNGTAFDPGGIGKGLAADIVVAMLIEEGARGALVNVGGDLVVAGEAPDDGGWTVEIEHPRDGSIIARVALAEGGIATSSPLKRKWRQGNVRRHHLIDPASRRPARSVIASVTAIASQGWRAEVAAKAAFFAGDHDALEGLRALGASGLILRADGSIRVDDDFWRFVS